MGKKLIINADDYGLSTEVNDAIENLINAGKLKSVSVLANSLFSDEALGFLAGRQDCSIGIHLNVVEGVSLTRNDRVRALLGENGRFLALPRILSRWVRSPWAVARAVETEWRAQIEMLQASGIMISHLDSHQHIHAFPAFWRIVVRLCQEYGIPTLRLPRETNGLDDRRAAAFGLATSASVAKMLSSRAGLAFNDHFLGFKRAGAYGEAEMISDLRGLRDGVTELIVHPSLYDGIPYPKMRGELEYKALLGSRLWGYIAGSEIELVTWSDVSSG